MTPSPPGDFLYVALRDPERLGRFRTAASALASATTVEEALQRIVNSLLALAHADRATLTLTEHAPQADRVLSAGVTASDSVASLERELWVDGVPYAFARLHTARRAFRDEESALVELFLIHAALAIERVSLRDADTQLRRVRMALDGAPNGTVRAAQRRIGPIRLDLSAFEAFRDDTAIRLTPSEFRLLELLSEEPGRVYTRHEIVSRLWRSPDGGSPRVADAHVRRLRRKLEADPRHPALLTSVRGIGYRLTGSG